MSFVPADIIFKEKTDFSFFECYHAAIMDGTRTSTHSKNNDDPRLQATAQAFADIKFTYVVSCQVYGMQKKSTDTRDRSCYQNILNLMIA